VSRQKNIKKIWRRYYVRVRIEVNEEVDKEGKSSFYWTVEMAIGNYGKFERVGTGYSIDAATAEKSAEEHAVQFLAERRSQPIVRKYLNL
jgi:hypothetical protein